MWELLAFELVQTSVDKAHKFRTMKPMQHVLVVGLPDHMTFFQGHFVFKELRWAAFILSWTSARGAKRAFAPPEIGLRTKNF